MTTTDRVVVETMFGDLIEVDRPTCLERGCTEAISDAVLASNGMGCRVMCEPHFLAYHRATTVAEVVERKRKAAAVKHKCRTCGAPAQWVAGAGGPLCTRHENDY